MDLNRFEWVSIAAFGVATAALMLVLNLEVEFWRGVAWMTCMTSACVSVACIWANARRQEWR